MKITFIPLQESHFPLLLKWLEAPHVKAWWDQDVHWNLELIKEKFGDCAKGCRFRQPDLTEFKMSPIYKLSSNLSPGKAYLFY
jgi:hypothetical protein